MTYAIEETQVHAKSEPSNPKSAATMPKQALTKEKLPHSFLIGAPTISNRCLQRGVQRLHVDSRHRLFVLLTTTRRACSSRSASLCAIDLARTAAQHASREHPCTRRHRARLRLVEHHAARSDGAGPSHGGGKWFICQRGRGRGARRPRHFGGLSRCP
ncbi:hypothetical protein BDY21DRAFT_73221 [Lineolata rhizophorae]|uniref:Uncharacterized protein n=1 Tax=Lineolata rhizophorae TaxID=578093 RepID=A0A6A6NV07_9PEZI|nr:hypothetical protein BDY21DRAFT_73221 [Lineolata rhizophorae]